MGFCYAAERSNGSCVRRTNHRILGKVVVGAPSNGVQLHQVLKIGDFSVHPFLCIYDNKHICLN